MRCIQRLWKWGLAILGIIGGLAVWHYYSLDGLDGILAQWLYEADTAVYAPGYSDKAFRRIRKGMSSQEVLHHLGKPVVEAWVYPQKSTDDSVIVFTEEKVTHVRLVIGKDWHFFEDAYVQQFFPTLEKGKTTMAEVKELFGEPQYTRWAYSYSPGSGSFRIRDIMLKEGYVEWKGSGYYVD